MDARHLFKPMLARGELHCVGATTLDGYRKHVEKDAALERRFQPVLVDQPSLEDTISILRRLKERYEVRHGVPIKDAALVSAAVLSTRYISDRCLPDNAINVVDKAAAKLRTEIDSMPSRLDEILRRVMQLEIAPEALKRKTDSASQERLAKLGQELNNLRAQADALKAQWQAQKKTVQRLLFIREQIEQTKIAVEQAQRQYDLNRVAELRDGRLTGLEHQLRAEEEHLAKQDGQPRLIKEEVDEEDIAEVVLRARLAERHIELDLTERGALPFTSVEEAVAAEAKTS